MNKLMFAMAGAAILVSSGALAQSVDTAAECNKGTEIWRTAYNNRDAGALANMFGNRSHPRSVAAVL